MMNEFPGIAGRLRELGYRPVTAEDYNTFAPYYDEMNEAWSSALSFVCILAWSDAVPAFYKVTGRLITCLQYDGTVQKWTAIPFIGHYSDESFGEAFSVLRSDMRALGLPMLIVDASEWMLPFYQGVSGVFWNVERPRKWMDYIYRREDFVKSMESSDFRYRYRYFLRHFSPETVPLGPEHREECMNLMREAWCSSHECSECFACPLKAVGRVAGAMGTIGAEGLLVRVNGKAAGFCVVSMRNGVAVYEFKHANNRMKGINEYMLKECFTRFLSGVEEINFTEDIGNEGLRAYKCRLAPYTLAARITLSAMELREATPEEVRLVYERDLVEAFPYEELRTLPEIEELIRRGKYKFLCLHDGPEIVASLTLYSAKPGWMLWDYLYVNPSHRTSFLGSHLIRSTVKRYHDSVIIADAESPEHAPDPSFARKRLALFRRTG
ncbi:MAG: hypothetical protein IJT02_08020, partial [Synergistaceae bacterium]|nr:hypothetical protein [Synergistaceae bacterium]